jgi:hypothetical protein
MLGMLKLLFSKTISPILCGMVAYVSLIIFVLYKVHFWNITLLKDSIVWLLGVGFIMFINANKALKDDYYFKEILKENIKLTIIIEFVINLYVFSLPVEIFLLPTITGLALFQLVSQKDEKNELFTKFLNSVLSILGLIIISYVSYKLMSDFKGFFSISNLKSFLLPVFLTLAYIPFIYGVALFMLYQEFFIAMDSAYRHHKLLGKYAKWQVLRSGKYKLTKARSLRKNLHVFTLDTRKKLDAALAEIEQLK